MKLLLVGVGTLALGLGIAAVERQGQASSVVRHAPKLHAVQCTVEPVPDRPNCEALPYSKCDTDIDCQLRYGGDGGPMPAAKERYE